MCEEIAVTYDRPRLIDVVAKDRLLESEDVRRQPLVATAQSRQPLPLPVSPHPPDVVRGNAQSRRHRVGLPDFPTRKPGPSETVALIRGQSGSPVAASASAAAS